MCTNPHISNGTARIRLSIRQMARTECGAPIAAICTAALIPGDLGMAGLCAAFVFGGGREPICDLVGIPRDEYELNVGPTTPPIARDALKFNATGIFNPQQ